MWQRFRSLDGYGQAAIAGAVLSLFWMAIAALVGGAGVLSPLSLVGSGLVIAGVGAFLGVVFWWRVVEQRKSAETGVRRPELGALMLWYWPRALLRLVLRGVRGHQMNPVNHQVDDANDR